MQDSQGRTWGQYMCTNLQALILDEDPTFVDAISELIDGKARLCSGLGYPVPYQDVYHGEKRLCCMATSFQWYAC